MGRNDDFYGNTGAVRAFIETCTEGVRWMTKLVQSVEDLTAQQESAAKDIGLEAAEDATRRQIELVNAAKDAYIKSGKEEVEALELAKNEKVAVLQKQLDEEIKLRDKYYKENQDLWKAQSEANFFKQALGLDKTDAQYRDEINKAWDNYLKQLSYIESLQSQIGSINKMTIKTVDESKAVTELTDKEKNALLKIEEDYQEARISLMEEGLEKEIAQIQLNFNKRIAQIKGNSKREQELREMYAQLMQREISEKEIEYAESEYDRVLNAEERQQKKKVDLIKKYSEISAINLTTSQITAESELEEEYRQGLINREEYEREKFELQKHYNEMALRNAIETAKVMIALMPDGAEKDRAIANLQKAHAELKALMASEFTGGLDSAEDWKKSWILAVKMVSETFNGIADIIGSSYERRIQAVDDEMEANEEAGERELERIQELADKGVITTEEAEARKRAAEEKTSRKNEELEKKKAALQTKQAKLEKAANIASTIMNTAVAVMKVWGQAGLFGAPMAAYVAAMGAIQLATIIAQPIPKYAKGTKGHKGGLAWVGDGGVSETVITSKGAFLTPDTPTLVDLPKGAKVIPYALDMETMKAMALNPNLQISKEEKTPININNDYTGLQKDIRDLKESQKRSMKQIAKLMKQQDYKRFAASV